MPTFNVDQGSTINAKGFEMTANATFAESGMNKA